MSKEMKKCYEQLFVAKTKKEVEELELAITLLLLKENNRKC